MDADLQSFYNQLTKIKYPPVILRFPAPRAHRRSASTGNRATIIPFAPPAEVRVVSRDDKIQRILTQQRMLVAESARRSAIKNFVNEIVALEAADLPIEREIKLDMLRRDFENHLQIHLGGCGGRWDDPELDDEEENPT